MWLIFSSLPTNFFDALVIATDCSVVWLYTHQRFLSLIKLFLQTFELLYPNGSWVLHQALSSLLRFQVFHLQCSSKTTAYTKTVPWSHFYAQLFSKSFAVPRACFEMILWCILIEDLMLIWLSPSVSIYLCALVFPGRWFTSGSFLFQHCLY